VRAALPDPPADVIEIGCGPSGGFVPTLLEAGYTAVGIDPQAPQGPSYLAMEFESYQPPHPVDAVIASSSLHHVADLGQALDGLIAALRPGGTAVVIEWATERFDEATARWCFDRLPTQDPPSAPSHQPATGPQHGRGHQSGPGSQPPPGHQHGHGHQDSHQHGPQDEQEHSWMVAGRQAWLDSGLPWPEFIAAWRAEEGLHTGGDVIAGLNARLRQRSCGLGPYFFPELDATTEADEQAAIEAGLIQPTRIRYAGTKPPA
jgi:SAM-dependent methyltransferase